MPSKTFPTGFSPLGAVTAATTVMADDGVANGTATVQEIVDAVVLGAISPGGRLTLTTGVPVTPTDVTGATSVFYAPYRHRLVPIYNGTRFVVSDIGAELTQTLADTTKSPAAAVSNAIYDMFVWNDAGTFRCTRGPAWSTATARGTGAGTTELARVNGILTNAVAISNGPAANRGTYVGSIRTNGSTQLTDAQTARLVWNMYNRVERQLRVVDTTDTWNYSVAAWRQANNAAANQFDILKGLDEDSVFACAVGRAANNTSTFRDASTGIGLDSTTALAANQIGAGARISDTVVGTPYSYFSGHVGLGYHYVAWLERGAGTDTQSWLGDGGATVLQTGMVGHTLA